MCIQVNLILQIAVAAARTRLQGTAETGDAKECCDEEHAGNDDNPPRVCEQSLSPTETHYASYSPRMSSFGAGMG